MVEESVIDQLWLEYRTASQYAKPWEAVEEGLASARDRAGEQPPCGKCGIKRNCGSCRIRRLRLRKREIRKAGIRAKKQAADLMHGIWQWVAECEGPPPWFRGIELGFIDGPSILFTISQLKNGKRILAQIERKYGRGSRLAGKPN